MTDQEKREKVLKGLECCYIQKNGIPPRCEACPYMNPMEGTCDNLDELLGDALTLLKAQEPRIMSLEEIPYATFGWIEVSEQLIPCVLEDVFVDDTVGFASIEDGHDYMCASDYGKTWRVWTSRPTDEQREATPWKN